jgi:3-dehydroquinate dehydratase
VIEVDLTTICNREPFRFKSTITTAAPGIICGRGRGDYDVALDALAERLQSTPAMLDF